MAVRLRDSSLCRRLGGTDLVEPDDPEPFHPGAALPRARDPDDDDGRPADQGIARLSNDDLLTALQQEPKRAKRPLRIELLDLGILHVLPHRRRLPRPGRLAKDSATAMFGNDTKLGPLTTRPARAAPGNVIVRPWMSTGTSG